MSGTPDVSPGGAKDTPGTGGLEGVEVERVAFHSDHRGTLCEVIDVERPFWREPVVYAYSITVRPGRIKGWGMHELQADRYFVVAGSMRVVLYDGRVASRTYKRFQELQFTPQSTGLLRIPPGVWHADQNWGDDDVVIMNFPTHAYRHDDPDKYRISTTSGEIPFDFGLADY